MGWADPLVDWRIHPFMFECARVVLFAFFVCFMTFGLIRAAALCRVGGLWPCVEKRSLTRLLVCACVHGRYCV